MVPGMMHCGGGPGPNTFDTVAAMEQWKEQGTPPETMLASRFKDPIAVLAGLPTGAALATRPICAYPKIARWTGKGSPVEAGNYECIVPNREKERRASR
jgi:feruloyl esterase